MLGRPISEENESNGSSVTEGQTFDLQQIARQFGHRPIDRLIDLAVFVSRLIVNLSGLNIETA